MDLRPEEHEALHKLARYGAMPLGRGPDCIPTSAAIRLSLGGFAQLTLCQGRDQQQVEITRQGSAFRTRTAT
jgi:hypothetical protein